MKDNYDFSKAKRNPYTELIKKTISINLDQGIIDYFKDMSKELGIPYQTLINMYLRDCVNNKKKIDINWK